MKLSYIQKNTSTVIIKVAISSISTLVILPFLIRKIGMDRYGLLALTTLFTGFTGIFDLGLSKSLVYLVNHTSNIDHRNNYISVIRWINLSIIFILLFIITILLLEGIEIFGNSISNTNPYFIPVVSASLIMLAITIYNNFQLSLLEAFFCLHYVNIGITINVVSLNLLYVINLMTINNMTLYIFSPLTAYSISILYYRYIIHKKINYKPVLPSRKYLKTVGSSMINFFKVGAISSLYLPICKYLLAYLSPSTQYIGIMDIILKLNLFITNFVTGMAQPLLAISVSRKQEARKLIKKYTPYLGGIIFIYILCVIALKDFILNYFFAINPTAGQPIFLCLVIFSIGFGLYSLSMSIEKYLLGTGNYKLIFRTNCFILLFNILCIILLYNFIRYLNILLNISISINLSFCIMAICYFIKYKRER